MQRKTGGLRRLVRWARDCLVENIPGAKPTWEFIKTESRGVKQGWVLFTVIGLVIVVVTASVTHKIDHFATIPTVDWRSQDPPIKQQTLRLAAQIPEFIRDWNDSDDETVQRENVDKYMTRFGHAALAMRDGLDQHGVRSPELDKLMFEFSNSYKDVRAIPAEFEKLANASPVQMQFEVTEKDPEARQKLSETQKRVEELAGKLKQANETIEKLTPIKRSLTRDQHERLVAALKDGNSYKIAIRREPQTPETQDYSDQFASVFKEAGWMIVAPMILDRPTDMNEIIELMHLRAEKGIRLLVHDGKHPPQQAYKLSKAMMLAGIPVMVDEVESITEDTVEFFIGVPEEATRPSPTPNMEVSPH